MFHSVGSRAAIFPGEGSAASPVDVIYLVSGNELSSGDTMKRVPLDMYMLRNIVQPGTCSTIVVSGRPATAG